MTILIRNLLIVVCLLFLISYTRVQTLRVAAASDLQFAMKDLSSQYEKETGSKVEVSYGSSGKFFAKIENGAPLDLFFSADAMYPPELVEAGAADKQSLFVYAQGPPGHLGPCK
jgi:molybdate transport system substrate-binding protein